MIYKKGLTLLAATLISLSSFAQLPEKVGGLLSVDRTAETFLKMKVTCWAQVYY
ncbi:Uncharacterised protein [Sphingobacterium daejeonense]|nr:Uncharacterised protein [Sphingobacterium daejeonense]